MSADRVSDVKRYDLAIPEQYDDYRALQRQLEEARGHLRDYDAAWSALKEYNVTHEKGKGVGLETCVHILGCQVRVRERERDRLRQRVEELEHFASEVMRQRTALESRLATSEAANGELMWTDQKPSKPGFYWHKGTDGTNEPRIVQVWKQGMNWMCQHHGSVLRYTIPTDGDRGYHGQWAGPIAEPHALTDGGGTEEG